MAAPWYRPFKNAFRSGCYLLAHALVAIMLIGLIAIVKWILVEAGDPKLFDFCPLRYIFDAVDVAVLCVFLVFGIREAIKVFRENEDV